MNAGRRKRTKKPDEEECNALGSMQYVCRYPDAGPELDE